MTDLRSDGKPKRPARFGFRKILPATAIVLFSVALPPAQPAAEDLKKSGTVEIEQTQIAFIGSGNLGGGKLSFGGKTYNFTIGGLGVGGIGVSKITATGTVYNLSNLEKFPGAYVQGRTGYAAGDKGTGTLWLKNEDGVVLELKTKREGLALSLGGDAVYIKFD
jgi:hypothetical protein